MAFKWKHLCYHSPAHTINQGARAHLDTAAGLPPVRDQGWPLPRTGRSPPPVLETSRKQLPARKLTQLGYEHCSNTSPFAPAQRGPDLGFLGCADVCVSPASRRQVVNGVYKVCDLALDSVNLCLLLSHPSRHATLSSVVQSCLGTRHDSVDLAAMGRGHSHKTPALGAAEGRNQTNVRAQERETMD